MQNMAGAVVHEGYIQYKPHVVDPEKICLHSPPSTGSSVRPSPPHSQLRGHRSDRPPPTLNYRVTGQTVPPPPSATGSSVRPSPPPHTNYQVISQTIPPHTQLPGHQSNHPPTHPTTGPPVTPPTHTRTCATTSTRGMMMKVTTVRRQEAVNMKSRTVEHSADLQGGGRAAEWGEGGKGKT